MKSYIFTKEWFVKAGIRALKTMAQTAIATIGTTALFNEVNWIVVGSASLLAGILSLLTSLAGLPELEEASQEEFFEETSEDELPVDEITEEV